MHIDKAKVTQSQDTDLKKHLFSVMRTLAILGLGWLANNTVQEGREQATQNAHIEELQEEVRVLDRQHRIMIGKMEDMSLKIEELKQIHYVERGKQ